MDFKDQRVLITGSTRGIGRAAASAFLEQGARVAINGRREADVERAIGELGSDRLVAAAGDLASADACRSVVESAIRGLGGLDVLVNNAGIYSDGPVEMVDESTYDRMMDVNVKGVFFCSNAAIPSLRESGGNIVNTSSECGIVGFAGMSLYCASKGAVSNLTRAMASELAPTVRVNAVCPAAVMTDMTGDGIAPSKLDDYLNELRDSSLMKYIAQPEEIADAILYLANPRSRFVTGSMLSVDGGSTGCR